MKSFIFVGVTLGGILGGWLGSMLDHGNGFGIWSIFLSTVGSFAGIWAGYKAARNYLG
ncbi:hypothetical protein H7097_00620 [Aeromicrobium sp.]|nr:hypothetical protein [Candidatus Saccharibacteria bacterium]